ncbi:MAG TPA: hypothetical protein VKA43_11940 [Gammaproteobacteria bacterium]|nr:hypothetical protein [Gammaproteobacteria bacterium]
MSSQPAPGGSPPSGRRIALSVLGALAVAGVVLVTAVLPAEYGIDPLGIGGALGFTELNSQPTRTLTIKDVLGGNETVREVEIPAFNEPVPLPNPAVHQPEDGPIQTRTVTLTLEEGQQTEIKTMLRASKVIVYTWKTDGGLVYCDLHGHDPAAGQDFFVRYREDQEGATEATGSLVAPFDGEHGWYWLNISEGPVTITLTVTGFFDDIIDYGIF